MHDLGSSLLARANLTPQQLAIFESEMTKRRKNIVLAYLLLLFLGGFGAHRFYLGSTPIAIVQLICCVVGLLTVAIFIGIIPLAITGIIAIVDLFLTPGMTNAANERLEREILARLPALVPA